MRWTKDSMRRLPAFAYFPFGGGSRLCIGRDLAMLETILIVATIARRFRFRPGRAPLKGIEPSITLRPAGPMLLSVTARSP
jgi:cytochrome P450